MEKPAPVSIGPKYAIGNIVESEKGSFGRIHSIEGHVFWAQDGTSKRNIVYRLRDGGGFFVVDESDVVRVVAEE